MLARVQVILISAHHAQLRVQRKPAALSVAWVSTLTVVVWAQLRIFLLLLKLLFAFVHAQRHLPLDSSSAKAQSRLSSTAITVFYGCCNKHCSYGSNLRRPSSSEKLPTPTTPASSRSPCVEPPRGDTVVACCWLVALGSSASYSPAATRANLHLSLAEEVAS